MHCCLCSSTTALFYDFYGLTPGALYLFSVITVLTVENGVMLSNATNLSIRLGMDCCELCLKLFALFAAVWK